jgi:hypothetical protein
MPKPATTLEHPGAEKKTDDQLREEAERHLAQRPELQIVAELYAKLRALELPWWTPEILRRRWSAERRLGWLAQRADLRQAITVRLSGLAPKAARSQKPQFQAALIDSVLDEGDVSVKDFEAAFDPKELAVYGPAAELWREFRERMPWEEDTKVHQELVAWLLSALLASASPTYGLARRPILTPWDVRTRVDGRLWHTHIPLEVRVAIDEARHAREREHSDRPFLAVDDLAIATPAVITESVPLRDLMDVFLGAESILGFEEQKAPPPDPAGPDEPEPDAAPPSGPSDEPTTAQEPTTRRKKAPAPMASYRPAAADAPPPPAAPASHTEALVAYPDAEIEEIDASLVSRIHDEDDLARTNQWAVPSVDDMWTGEYEAVKEGDRVVLKNRKNGSSI